MMPKILSTQKVVYPLDYDKNGKAGFQEWRKYISAELAKSISPTEMLIVEANKVLTKDSRYKDEPSSGYPFEPNVKVDRWVYVLMFSLAITIALLNSI